MLSESAMTLKQKGPLCALKGEHANVAPLTQEAPLMRLSVASLRRMIKGKLHVEFVHQELTSYGGLELLRRYLRQLDLPRRLHAACAATGGDYGGGRLALLILSLFYVGARRLEHLRYVAGDPLIARFCGLARLPTARTMGNWLRQFTQVTLAPLVQLNHDLVIDAITRPALPRLTIDVDGTVVCTGATVGWAFRGFNPHHRKDPSYYPLLAHVAQTGHILRVKIYRKHVGHESPKNFQLDLFTPDDGHFEYAAVATSLALDLPALYAFICGRGAQEKTIAELKGEFALDVIPTRHYGANSTWQQLSVLAHNLIRSFQLDTLPVPKPRSRKRTYTYLIRSMRTLRFLLVARAGRLTRIGGRHVLRMAHNPATEALYAKIDHRLAA